MRPPRDPGDAMTDPRSTDFGYERVSWREKARRVRGVFDSVAGNYDLMNDLMSGGAHRLWKRFTLALTGLRPGQRALDVAGGTGDLAAGLARQVGDRGLVVLSDINSAMLRRGRDRLTDQGVVGNVHYVQANAERLPFPDDSFDCITIGFGLRNVTEQACRARRHAAGAEARRAASGAGVLPPRGAGARGRSMTLYSFRVLPLLGRVVARDEASYRYLAESIRMHPGPGDAARDDAGGRARGLPLSQPFGRHRRGAPRLQVLTGRPHADRHDREGSQPRAAALAARATAVRGARRPADRHRGAGDGTAAGGVHRQLAARHPRRPAGRRGG